jgi:hypothetical protein
MVGYAGGTVTASFVYDGDGNRVKGVVNGTTPFYVSDLYEVSGTKVTKYYAEGGTKAALRVSGSTGSTISVQEMSRSARVPSGSSIK